MLGCVLLQSDSSLHEGVAFIIVNICPFNVYQSGALLCNTHCAVLCTKLHTAIAVQYALCCAVH